MMHNKGRRLKRYLGLRRQKSDWLLHEGGIDTLQPGRLSGWVVAPGLVLHEVRLVVGSNLIAKSEINQPRQDVCETLGWQGNPGFSLDLPSELPMVNWQDSARVIALSADGSQVIELGILGRRKKTAEIIKALLQSDLVGLVGHCDGLVMGAIRGWTCRRGQQRPAQIWLQATGKEPLAVACGDYRDGMQSMNLPSNCGFVVDPGSLPADWAGQEVWLSFDRESQFRLPQQASVVLPAFTKTQGATSDDSMHILPAQPFQAMMQAAPEELQEHWRALESFRTYLDHVESQLAQQQAQALVSTVEKMGSKKRWWGWLLGAKN